MTNGDDLAAARRFSNLCHETMSTLVATNCEPKSEALDALEIVQVQAKYIQALAISRAARSTMDELTAATPQTRGLGSLLALNKLIRQYTDGLDEIAPEDVFNPIALEERLEAYIATQQTELERAHDVLVSIKSLVRPGIEASAIDALLTLANFEPVTIETDTRIEFDSVMPAVTNETLRSARHAGKSVSVSYAADDMLITPEFSLALQSAIIAICDQLVHRCVEAPLRRKNQGLSGAAHIAVTARKHGQCFDMLLTCEGPLPKASLLEAAPIANLRAAYGAKIKMQAHKGLSRIELSNLPIARNKPRLDQPAPRRLPEESMGRLEMHG